jgi:hypothetical protein
LTIFFTICSKNYLAQATALASSFKKIHGDEEFVIGLADILVEEERSQFKSYSVLEMDALGVPEFSAMKERYNIVELNTAVKPFYINHFFTERKAEKVVYLDPDIIVFSSLSGITDGLDKYSYILTPHFTTPIYDQCMLSEHVPLGTGTFNLGFFAIRNDETGRNLLAWWSKKLEKECVMDLPGGYFVDQKWMNLSICHFDNYLVEKHSGLNVAHWNLHERTLSVDADGTYRVNGNVPLIFFHFSSFRPEHPERIATWQNRYTFESRPDIAPLFAHYAMELKRHGYDQVSKLKPAYGKSMSAGSPGLKARIKSKLISLIERF